MIILCLYFNNPDRILIVLCWEQGRGFLEGLLAKDYRDRLTASEALAYRHLTTSSLYLSCYP